MCLSAAFQKKTDSLISMRIDLSANLAPDQSLDVWHASLPPNAAADIKTELAFDLQLNDKLVEIDPPGAFYLARKRCLCEACRHPVHL
jgi:hypothetical protein